ncbi:dihydrolipoamide acetyltransferase family protein [Actinomadura geliboluensis]
MAELLPVPEVAAGATEVVLSEWLVEQGAPVKAGSPIAIVETEKAVVEIEAEVDTVVLRFLAEPGAACEVGSPMALVGTADETNADPDALLAGLGLGPSAGKAEKDSEPAPPRRDVPECEHEPAASGPGPVPRQRTGDVGEAGAPGASSSGTSMRTESSRRFISPLARRLLREAGVAVDDVTGTGPNGRIMRRDVERAIARHASTPAEPAAEPATEPATGVRPPGDASAAVPAGRGHRAPASAGAYVEEEHSRLRRAVAARLTQSKREVPHFYLKRAARLDALLRLRGQVNQQSPARVSVNDFVIRAVAVAHRAVPDANVIWTDAAMRRFESVDVAVAIASERGLVTPVLRSAESMSVSAVSAQVKSFVEQANTGRLSQRDLEGGSISVTNLGMYGVDEFAAIINPPHSAILAVGAARPTSVAANAREGAAVEVATMVQLTLSVDHRAIDGALAAQWMDVLVNGLENPLRLLV